MRPSIPSEMHGLSLFIKQTYGILLCYTLQHESTFAASHSLNITHNSVYNQCCTVCGCPEGASTQNIVCHYVLLGWRWGDNSVEKMLFSKTILSHSTTPYLGYFLCILVVRFLMRGHLSRVSKAYQTTKANFIPREKLPILKLLPSLVSCSLFCQLLSWPLFCERFCHFLCQLVVEPQQAEPFLLSQSGTTFSFEH